MLVEHNFLYKSKKTMMTKPTIICITSIKNEAWILHRYLKCASLWADHIIILNQNSDDSYKDITNNYSKVIIIDSDTAELSQPQRQKVLIESARQFPEPRLLIALDADEMLSSNFLNHPEWQTVMNAPLGTVIEFQWVNILPGFTSYWSPNNWYYPIGFMDDGSEHFGEDIIHSPRIPEPPYTPRIRLNNIKLLHYQYINWERMKSKQRWYQCYERLNKTGKRLINIYRMYHQMDAFPQNEIHPFSKELIDEYEQQGIDMTSVYLETIYWYEKVILEWMSKYGTKKFKELAIWDVNWSTISNKLNHNITNSYEDPRSFLDKLIHYWLKNTQPIKHAFFVRVIDKLLVILGW